LYDTVNLQWSTDESFAVIDGRANGLITNNYTINYLTGHAILLQDNPVLRDVGEKGEYGVFVQHGLYGFRDRHRPVAWTGRFRR
jgi:hypothetical protein